VFRIHVWGSLKTPFFKIMAFAVEAALAATQGLGIVMAIQGVGVRVDGQR
jgi:hypothetical protein